MGWGQLEDDFGMTWALLWQNLGILWHTLAYSVILWHTLAYSDILWHTLAYSGILWHTLAYSGILWHTLAYSSILWHTLAYSGILWHTPAYSGKVALALVDQAPQLGLSLHEGHKGLAKLQLVAGDGGLASGQLLAISAPGSLGHLPHVGGEGDHVVILVDVVHDLHLEESLGGVVHDLVGKFGLSDVLSQLLDAVDSSLGCSIFVNHLVALILGLLATLELSDQVHDHGELTPEERILGGVHCVLVHLQQVQVDAGDGLDEALERGVDLELLEQARNDAAGGGPGESDLVVDDDGGVDGGADQGVADDVEVSLVGSSRVADGDPHVHKAGEVGLQAFNGLGEGLQVLDLNLLLLLADGEVLQLASVLLGASLHHLLELQLVGLDGVPGDISKLGVLSDLVGRPGADGLTVDIHVGLLPQVQPDDGAVLGVDGAGHLLEDVLEASGSGLASAVDLVAWDPVEVGGSDHRLRKLLDLVEGAGHGRGLPYLGVLRHPEPARLTDSH